MSVSRQVYCLFWKSRFHVLFYFPCGITMFILVSCLLVGFHFPWSPLSLCVFFQSSSDRLCCLPPCVYSHWHSCLVLHLILAPVCLRFSCVFVLSATIKARFFVCSSVSSPSLSAFESLAKTHGHTSPWHYLCQPRNHRDKLCVVSTHHCWWWEHSVFCCESIGDICFSGSDGQMKPCDYWKLYIQLVQKMVSFLRLHMHINPLCWSKSLLLFQLFVIPDTLSPLQFAYQKNPLKMPLLQPSTQPSHTSNMRTPMFECCL